MPPIRVVLKHTCSGRSTSVVRVSIRGVEVTAEQSLKATSHAVQDVVLACSAILHGGDDAVNEWLCARFGGNADADGGPTGGHLDEEDGGEGDHAMEVEGNADEGFLDIGFSEYDVEDVVGCFDGA